MSRCVLDNLVRVGSINTLRFYETLHVIKMLYRLFHERRKDWWGGEIILSEPSKFAAFTSGRRPHQPTTYSIVVGVSLSQQDWMILYTLYFRCIYIEEKSLSARYTSIPWTLGSSSVSFVHSLHQTPLLFYPFKDVKNVVNTCQVRLQSLKSPKIRLLSHITISNCGNRSVTQIFSTKYLHRSVRAVII